jgi:hypothetical protein
MRKSIQVSERENHSLSNKRQTAWILTLSGVVWLLTLWIGFGKLLTYSYAAGPVEVSPGRWPAESQIHSVHERPTLIMFAHPKCPCTRASLGELARLVAMCPGKFDAHVEFLRPVNCSEEWARSDLWDNASVIPGVTVRSDSNGVEAGRFNATTSGYVVLYSASGDLLFSGGITASRGHSGDNAGRDALVMLLNGSTSVQIQTPVFGCPLGNADTACSGGMVSCAR